MKNIYMGALELIESKLHAVGLMMGRATDEWTVHSLKHRMDYLLMLKRDIIDRSGIRTNVIHVDFQLKRKVS